MATSLKPAPTDAYLLLAEADHYEAYGGVPRRVPIVAEFGSIEAAQSLSVFAPPGPILPPGVSGFLRFGLIVSCIVPIEWLKLVAAIPGLLRFEIALPFAGPRMPPRLAGAGKIDDDPVAMPADLSTDRDPASEEDSTEGTPALRAIIDTGCPFAHASLRRFNGTRSETAIRAIWDQDVAPDFGKHSVRQGIPYGAVLLRSEMNAAIRAHPAHTEDSERACYRALEYAEVKRSSSHGAACLGLLRNGIANARDEKDLPGDLLFVQLPRQLLSIPSRAALSKAILDGVHWILGQRKAAEKLVVVSISYASSLTAHDDSSLLAQGLQALIEAAARDGVTLHLVFAAGNDFEESLHAELEPTRRVVRWRHCPGNEVPCFAELWVVSSTPTEPVKGSIQVRTPSGETVSVDLEAAEGVVFSKNAKLAIVNSHWTGRDGRRLVLLRLNPEAATGDYLIALSEGLSTSVYVAHRRGTGGYRLQPSRSLLVDIPSQSSVVSGKGTLNGLACFSSAVVVGAYQVGPKFVDGKLRYTELATRYTASGPARIAKLKDFPDYSAKGSDSPSLLGVRVCGNFSAGSVRMGGTSVAAPQAGRRLARDEVASKPNDPRVGTIAQPLPIIISGAKL